MSESLSHRAEKRLDSIPCEGESILRWSEWADFEDDE